MLSVAQAMWDRFYKLFSLLHRLYGISCTGYVVRRTGCVGMLHRLCGVKTKNKAHLDLELGISLAVQEGYRFPKIYKRF